MTRRDVLIELACRRGVLVRTYCAPVSDPARPDRPVRDATPTPPRLTRPIGFHSAAGSR
jgi:hypothetical protein